MQGGINKIASK